MTSLPQGYDAWRLAAPDDERIEIGTEDGQPCMRIAETDIAEQDRHEECASTAGSLRMEILALITADQQSALDKMLAEERGACAQVAERHGEGPYAAKDIAAAIRARSGGEGGA